jgi:hypothetical protein
MTRFAKLPPLAALSTILTLGACAAWPPPPPGAPAPMVAASMPSGDCFSSNEWQSWTSPSDDVLFLRVNNNRFYRVDLLPGSGPIDRGGQFLISNIHGSGRICSVSDLDLKVASTTGFTTPLFPRAIRRLTDAEVAALPPGVKP